MVLRATADQAVLLLARESQFWRGTSCGESGCRRPIFDARAIGLPNAGQARWRHLHRPEIDALHSPKPTRPTMPARNSYERLLDAALANGWQVEPDPYSLTLRATRGAEFVEVRYHGIGRAEVTTSTEGVLRGLRNKTDRALAALLQPALATS